MIYTEAEIAGIKELRKLRVITLPDRPAKGDYLYARNCPPGSAETSQAQIFVVLEITSETADCLWLPRFDDLLSIARERKITFSQITDFIHRRRFADGREREGLIQLLIELNRSSISSIKSK